MLALGEFLLVEDGHWGVLVAPPTYERLPVWSPETVEGQSASGTASFKPLGFGADDGR